MSGGVTRSDDGYFGGMDGSFGDGDFEHGCWGLKGEV